MEVKVSVYCMAFNHEKYIRNALDGFLNQKTTFDFEVLVHDDASTDGTAQIVMEYANAYPDIIKPIIQTENQYSKGINIFSTFVYPQMKGQYIAPCEADDYWCDENKLQEQVDFLDSHLDYSACVHNTIRQNCITGRKCLFNSSEEEHEISVEKVLQEGGAEFHTSSVMYRKEFAILPKQFIIKGVGDYPRAIYLAMCGRIYYIPKVMSVYRMYVSGSWSSRTFAAEDHIAQINKHYNLINDMLGRVNEYSNQKYDGLIEKIREKNMMSVLLESGNLLEAKNKYPDIWKSLGLKSRVKYYLKCRFPVLVSMYRKKSLNN